MKALIVVLGIAGLTFWMARPSALRFMENANFQRRRNIWIALTIAAFLSPQFWMFAIFAIPAYIWIGRKDDNPAAAYLLLMHVVPPVQVELSLFGTQLFDVDNYRLLSLFLLVPAALQARRTAVGGRRHITDLFLLAQGLLQVALFVPPDLPGHILLHDSPTNFLRRLFLFSVDVFALYYVISRTCNERRKLADALATYCLGCAIMALIAVFEHLKRWLLYTELASGWNPQDANYLFAWLFRGDSWLRTQASAGHSLTLGFLLAIAFGFWLQLQSRLESVRTRVVVGAIFWAGMVAAFSRGPWIGAVLIYVAYAAMKPRSVTRVVKAGFIIVVMLGLLSLTPTGAKLIQTLPIVGSGQENQNFIYRQRLAARSIELIEEHPLFGDQFAIQNMEDLRQGQGIIDIVNSYIGIALFNGLVGLLLFLGTMATAALSAYRRAKAQAIDSEGALMGFNLVACIAGVAFMIADTSLIYGVQKMFVILIALAVAYARQPSPAAQGQKADEGQGQRQALAVTGRRRVDVAR